ncbi:MAG TPA: alanine racemase [Woeseiaceae bacterium]|nr:alanine racemase [Woeseiaceae bacterium]
MTTPARFRKCRASIDLAAIRANYRLASRLAPNSQSIAVIKGNAYGHGAVEVANALQGLAPAFAVGIIDEALELREAGIRAPILVLQGVAGEDALRAVSEQALSLVVHNEEQLAWLATAKLKAPVSTWLKIDTGMHRLGLPPDRLVDALNRLRASGASGDSIVVCTHLASADTPGSMAVREQLRIFDDCVAGLGVLQSISNSAGILAWPDTHRSWNRPGYLLYGNSPFAGEQANAALLRPAMTLASEVLAVRDVATGESVGYHGRWTAAVPSKIATVAIGYADGYPRHAPDGTPVLVNGAIAPLAGVVSMDLITVDVTALPAVKPGDPVVLWGPDLPANKIAECAGTIGYELLIGISRRVPRHYPN